jgi:hypothetical protein
MVGDGRRLGWISLDESELRAVAIRLGIVVVLRLDFVPLIFEVKRNQML